jgi:DNA-binding NarL/FixJ family response regulator
MTEKSSSTGTITMSSVSEPEPDREESVGVMVVDDQAGFRRVAQTLIGATAGFRAVGDAASGAEALRQMDQLRPDLVLMDAYMPGMDGFEAARRLTAVHRDCVVVLVSMENLDDLRALVAACGAVAFVRKQDLRPSLLRALWTAYGRRSLNQG